MQQGSPLLIGPGRSVVVATQANRFPPDSNHLDDVGQVFAFRGELDHGPFAEIADLDVLENIAAPHEEASHASMGAAQLLGEFGVSDLEAAAAPAPYSRSSLARSARASRISRSKARRSGLFGSGLPARRGNRPAHRVETPRECI